MAQSLESRPTVEDFRDDNPWVKLAKKYWLERAKSRKVKQDAIKKDIWNPLEAEGFSARSLLILENLNILERYAPHCAIRHTANLVDSYGRHTQKMRRTTTSY